MDVLTRQPSLLQSNIENNLRPKLAYLQDELQISQQNIGGLVVSNPRVLASSLGGKIIPMMDGLSDICDLTKSETGALLIRMPELMNMSWKSNIRQKAQFLMTRLGITNQELGTIVSRAPRILSKFLVFSSSNLACWSKSVEYGIYKKESSTVQLISIVFVSQFKV